MNFEAVKDWLTQQTSKQIRNRWLLAFLGILLTPIALAVSAFLIFIIVRAFNRGSDDPNVDAKCFWITLGIIPVLFVINYFMPSSNEPEKFYHEEPDDSLVGSYIHRRKTQARFFFWFLFTGPRLISWSIYSFREISRLKALDTHSCAAVLWLLMIKHSKVSYPDIQRELDWLDMDATLPQLARISGVRQLTTPPPGLSLSEDLRTAIRTGASVP
jgi:heme/copper-type cytochrome/quinol oxidase subunit 2